MRTTFDKRIRYLFPNMTMGKRFILEFIISRIIWYGLQAFLSYVAVTVKDNNLYIFIGISCYIVVMLIFGIWGQTRNIVDRIARKTKICYGITKLLLFIPSILLSVPTFLLYMIYDYIRAVIEVKRKKK